MVGAEMHHVAEEDVFAHLAGLTIGQDLSGADRQFSGPAPQFGLAKSYPGSRRSGRGSSLSTSSPTRTTWVSGAASTARSSSPARRLG